MPWGTWEDLGGLLLSSPAAVSWGTGRIDVFARGEENLFHLPFENDWGAWEDLGGIMKGGPGVCSWAPGRLDVFIRRQDNRLAHRAFQS